MASIGRVKPFVFVGTDPDPNLADLHAPGFPAPHDEPQPSDLYIDSTDPNSSKLWVYGFIADPVTPSWTLASSAGTDEVWLGPDQPADPALELWVDTDDPGSPGTTIEQEVMVSQSQPRAGALTELWVDTGNLPGKLKYNDPVRGWLTIAGGDNEMHVGSVDPFSVSPEATAEIWYDTDAVPVRTTGTTSQAWEELVALRKRVTVLETAITTMLRGN